MSDTSGPPAAETELGESAWWVTFQVGFFSLMAFYQAAGLQGDFAWWRVIALFVFGVFAGVWVAQLPALRRLFAWRTRKFGGVPVYRSPRHK